MKYKMRCLLANKRPGIKMSKDEMSEYHRFQNAVQVEPGRRSGKTSG